MSDYLVPVAAPMTGEQAKRLICPCCFRERDATYEEMVGGHDPALGECGGGCGFGMEWKYQEGDSCVNCGKLKFGAWPKVLDGCCSRVCQLQAEYAATLVSSGSRATATEGEDNG